MREKFGPPAARFAVRVRRPPGRQSPTPVTAFRVAVVALLLLAAPALLTAQRANLRLGTILPANSIWDRALKQMASEWQQATDGRLRLQVRGTTGDESTIIRRMRMNNPQVAAFSLPALTAIDDAFEVFGIPFFFADDAEARHVLDALTPRMRDALADNGLVLVGWGHGGWVHIFSADPVTDIDSLRRTKLFTASGDDGMVQWYKENGFNPVPLALTDVLMGLNTGLIDAYPSPPLWRAHLPVVPPDVAHARRAARAPFWRHCRDRACLGTDQRSGPRRNPRECGEDGRLPLRRGAAPGPRCRGGNAEARSDYPLGERRRSDRLPRDGRRAHRELARHPRSRRRVRRSGSGSHRVSQPVMDPPPPAQPVCCRAALTDR